MTSSIRRVSLWLSLVMIASLLLTACGRGGPGDTEAGQPGEGVATAIAPVQAPQAGAETPSTVSGEITVWAFADDIILNSIKATLPEFNQKYPDVKVNVVPVSGAEIHTKLLAAISSGQGIPDVAHVGVPDPRTFVDQDALWDITPRVQPYLDDILPYQIPPYQVNGKMYGVPWGGTAASVFYRRDVFEKAGIEPDQIKTWDDFIEAGKKLVSSTNGQVKMINLPIGSTGEKASLQHFQQLLAQQLGTGVCDAKDEVVVNDEGNVRALELIIKMIDAGIGGDVPPWTPAEFASWKNGMVATVVNASWMKGIIEGQAPETAGKWGIMKIPAFEEGGTRVSSAGGSGMVIPKASENKEAAWAYVEFFLLNGDTQVEAYRAGAPIPSIMSTYDDPVFEQPEEFWGGQKVGELYTELEPQVPTYYYGAHWREVLYSILPIGIWEAVTGKKDPQTALDDVKQTIETRFRSC